MEKDSLNFKRKDFYVKILNFFFFSHKRDKTLPLNFGIRKKMLRILLQVLLLINCLSLGLIKVQNGRKTRNNYIMVIA